ncbi:MAG TPA: LCP family protein [Firmicutes bacterium]|nr:LCP family protein [Bacillota bacterium]
MSRKKHRGKRILLVLLLVLVGSAFGWAWSVWSRIYEDVPPADDYRRDNSTQDEPGKNITNILLLGMDQRGNEAARADAILVLSLNHDTNESALISIPRDARAEIPGRGQDKINHAMAYGGINLLRATVEKLLGVPVHHYVTTNFAGFQGIVNTLGGVTIDVEKKMTVATYGDGLPPVTLQPGRQKLDGLQALAYVRFRKDNEGDFGRMRRQQQFLQAVATEVLQAKNLLLLPGLLEQAADFVRTDLSLTQALSLANFAAGLDLAGAEIVTLQGNIRMLDGVSYVILDADFLQQTVDACLRWNEKQE